MLFDYIKTQAELQARADDLFARLAAGDIKAHVGQKMALRELPTRTRARRPPHQRRDGVAALMASCRCPTGWAQCVARVSQRVVHGRGGVIRTRDVAPAQALPAVASSCSSWVRAACRAWSWSSCSTARTVVFERR